MRAKSLGWPILDLLAYLAVVTVNGLANALPLNGIQTGDVINKDPIYFLPANWAFSIWGLIYLGLGAFVVYALMPAGRADARLRRISPFFVASCALNAAWLFAWHWEALPLSQVLMLALLGVLIAIYLILRAPEIVPTMAERVCVRLPFSVYLGWICVATIANAAVTLHRGGWDGGPISQPVWAAIMVVVGGMLAALIGLRSRDAAFAAVFVWAFAAIAIRWNDTRVLAVTAWIVVALTVAVALLALARSLPPRPPVAGRGIAPAR